MKNIQYNNIVKNEIGKIKVHYKTSKRTLNSAVQNIIYPPTWIEIKSFVSQYLASAKFHQIPYVFVTITDRRTQIR